MEITLRKAVEADLKELTALSHITFREAYGEQNTAHDMDFFLENYFSEAWTLADLQDENTVYYLACDGNKMVGYSKLKIMNEDLLGQKRKVMELKRIYVLAVYHGTGIAQQLLALSEKHIREKGFKAFELAVWKENPRAIAFYNKSGFTITGETTFDWGTGKIDNDWVMVKSF